MFARRWMLVALALLWSTPSCNSIPSGFHDEVFLDNSVIDFKDPMDIEFYTDPNGSMQVILVDRVGRIYWIDNPLANSPTKQVVLDISDRVCSDGSRGLLSAELHPNFEENRWIYVFYTRVTDGACNNDRETGPVNRVARYEVSTHDNTIDESTELILFETSRTAYHYHNGGDMKFGKDGNLYITTGDSGHRPSCQDKSDLNGSILRVTEDGSIPDDKNAYKNSVRCNVMGVPPASDAGRPCAEIWAKGLRNPFRFSMDPDSAKTRFYISDVGGGTWEEIDEGGDDFRKVNYGWEEREGPCLKNRETGDDCDISKKYTDPVYWYKHNGVKGSSGGGSVVGGAFIPKGLWPKEYDGKYIFGDYVYGDLYLLSPSQACRECDEPIPGFTNSTFQSYPKIIDAKFGPYFDTKALYYLSRDPKVRAVRRVIYTGTEGNRPPVPVLTTNSSFVNVGGFVEFDASQSFDPDGDKMKFKFQFGQGKSLPWQKSPILVHQFKKEGKIRVRLRVKDNQGARDILRDYVTVGDLPIAEITSPLPGTEFSVGDTFLLSATASDPDGKPLSDDALSWEIRKHHNVHFHPFFDGVGNDLWTPTAPEPEDLYASTNSYLEVILRVTGSDGLVRETRRNVMPHIVEIDFDTKPSGLTLSIFDFSVVTPATVSCWEKQLLEVEASDNAGYSFAHWSDGADEDRVIHVVGKLEDKYIAVYKSD